jgi:hypothetical protein
MITRHYLGVVLALCVVLAGCAGDQPAEGGGGRPKITVVEPAEGAEVGSPVELRLSVSGAEIGSPDTGLMHFQVYVGNSGDYEVLTSTSGEVAAPHGQQTIRIVLAEPNHTETDVSASVSVDVTSGGGGGSGGEGGYTRVGDDDEEY